MIAGRIENPALFFAIKPKTGRSCRRQSLIRGERLWLTLHGDFQVLAGCDVAAADSCRWLLQAGVSASSLRHG
jgi:hypothetical protein